MGRVGDNLWEASNKDEYNPLNFDARLMTMQLRIVGEILECKFEADSNLVGDNTTLLSWDHPSTDGWSNWFSGSHPDAMWLKMDGVPENASWQTSATSDILSVAGIAEGWFRNTQVAEGTFRIKFTH